MSTDPEPFEFRPLPGNSQENSQAPDPTEEQVAAVIDEFEKRPEISEKQVKRVWGHLEPYRWKKGQSGNLAGRPRKKPMTEALELIGQFPCPPTKIKQLEEILGLELPRKLTFQQAAAIGQYLRALTDPDTFENIAIRTDGPADIDFKAGTGPGAPPGIVPNITFQFVNVDGEGNTVNAINVGAPPPIGEEPNAPPPKPTPAPATAKPVIDLKPLPPASPKDENGSGDAAAELPGSDSR